MGTLQIFNSLEMLTRGAAARFAELSSQAASNQNQFTAALSGGSTPLPLYQLLGKDPFFEPLPWSSMHFFWGDERLVPPDHEDSNYRAAAEHLLESRPIPDENIHRIPGELAPAEAASQYQRELAAFFSAHPPRFDLILLGLGEDCHTASLFPNTPAVTDPQPGDWVAANYLPRRSSWRITLTPRVINAAAEVIFLVSGKSKAAALKTVLQEHPPAAECPARLISPTSGNLRWYVDRQAASQLR